MSQLSRLRTLRNAEGGGWNTDDASYYNGSPQESHTERFNMLRVHNPTPPPRAPPPIQVPVYPEYSHLTVYLTLAQLNAKIAAVTRSVLTYNEGLSVLIQPGPSRNPSKGLVAFVHTVTVPTSETPHHIGIFIGFGWFSRIRIDTFIRDDVQQGTARLFCLLYKVGSRFLNAEVCLPQSRTVYVIQSRLRYVLSFNGTGIIYLYHGKHSKVLRCHQGHQRDTGYRETDTSNPIPIPNR